MAPYEDSDFFQSWFRLFDPILSNGNYSYGAPQNIADDIYHRQSFGVYYDTESNSIENDEIIAHTLQEEFSRLDMEESPVYSHAGEDHSQALVHAWRSPPRNYSSGIRKFSMHSFGEFVVTRLSMAVVLIIFLPFCRP